MVQTEENVHEAVCTWHCASCIPVSVIPLEYAPRIAQGAATSAPCDGNYHTVLTGGPTAQKLKLQPAQGSFKPTYVCTWTLASFANSTAFAQNFSWIESKSAIAVAAFWPQSFREQTPQSRLSKTYAQRHRQPADFSSDINVSKGELSST